MFSGSRVGVVGVILDRVGLSGSHRLYKTFLLGMASLRAINCGSPVDMQPDTNCVVRSIKQVIKHRKVI